MKLCLKCKTKKPLDDFTRDKKRADGLNVYCRKCTRAQVAAYSASHPEKARQRSKDWYLKNQDRRALTAKQWLARNPGKSAEYCARAREKDPEASRAYQRAWYAKNRARQLAKDKAAREANLEKFLARERASYERNRAVHLAKNKRWREANRPRIAYYAASRRSALDKRTPPWLTIADLDAIETWFWYAWLLTESTGVLHHVDHVVPLRGKNVSGLNVPWNLQALPAIDNLKKSNRHVS